MYNYSLLGILWMVISPIITTLAYTFVGYILRNEISFISHFLSTYPMVLVWLLFRDSVFITSECFRADVNLIRNIKFPLEILPFGRLSAKCVDFAIGNIILTIFALTAGNSLNYNYLLLPLIFIQLVLFSIGLGFIISIPSLIYKDIRLLVKHIIPLFVFVTPVLFKSEQVPQTIRFWYQANPLVGIMESFSAIFFNTFQSLQVFSYSVIASLIVFIVGLLLFKRFEKKFYDFL